MKLQRLQNDVAAWAEKQFPGQTALGKAAHLVRESRELHEAIQDQAVSGTTLEAGHDLEEMADCLILLLHLAKMRGYAATVLLEAGFVKLDECKSRTWPAQPDSDGVYHHLEPTTISDDKFFIEGKGIGEILDTLPSAEERRKIA